MFWFFYVGEEMGEVYDFGCVCVMKFDMLLIVVNLVFVWGGLWSFGYGLFLCVSVVGVGEVCECKKLVCYFKYDRWIFLILIEWWEVLWIFLRDVIVNFGLCLLERLWWKVKFWVFNIWGGNYWFVMFICLCMEVGLWNEFV